LEADGGQGDYTSAGIYQNDGLPARYNVIKRGFLFTCIFYPFSRIMRVSPLCDAKYLGNALISCIILIASASSDNFGILQSAELIQIICEGGHHHFDINPLYSSN